MQEEQQIGNSTGLCGKYLTFSLSKEQYGIEILKVLELFCIKPITRVPRSPKYMKGVLNLRGKIIPVIDLRLKFGLPEAPYSDKTCIIVANVTVGENQHQVAVGMIVDTVLEVIHFDENNLSMAPEYGVTLDTKFIMAMGNLPDSSVAILLDLDKFLSSTELEGVVENTDKSF